MRTGRPTTDKKDKVVIVASADIIIAIFMLLIAFGGKQKGSGIYIGIGIMACMYIASAILIMYS